MNLTHSDFLPERRWCQVIVANLAISLIFAISLPPLHALDKNKHVSQYIHTSWRTQDGSAPSGMASITQTTDGFIWFVSFPGDIYRFDGIRLLRKHTAADFSSSWIGDIVAGHSGGLWVIADELLYLKDGIVTSHFPIEGGLYQSIIENADGSLWIAKVRSSDQPICHVTEHDYRCFGTQDGIPASQRYDSVVADGQGGLWLGGERILVQWHGHTSEVYPVKGAIVALARAANGTVWVGSSHGGLLQWKEGALRPFALPGFDGSKLGVASLLIDHDGSLWVGTDTQGLFRIHGTAVEHYGHIEGLSGDWVWTLHEDREGIVWAGTSGGIDSFRDPSIVTFSAIQGLGKDAAAGILATRDGTIWVANNGSLDLIKDGSVSSIRRSDGLPGEQVAAMLEDHAGNMWVGVDDGLYLFKDGRFRRLPEQNHQPLGMVVGITEDMEGNIWAECASRPRKLVRIRDFHIREVFSDSQVPAGHNLTPDPGGGIWVETRSGDMALLRKGVLSTTVQLYRGASPLNRQIVAQADGSVLAGTENGLLEWRQGEVQRLTTRNGLPCDFVLAFTQDQAKRWWLYTRCGVVEFADAELQRWWDNPDTIVQNRFFDTFDGAQPNIGSFTAAATTPDGRVWFSSGLVVQAIDPSVLSRKALPAETYIESLVADRKMFQAKPHLRVPPNPRDLEIDYTSPTFAIPQKVKFRYRLEGYDRDWHEVGERRQAFYTDLPPREYSFRVMAANSDGVWSENAANLDFVIAPAWYQTNWFRALCVIVFLALIWALYRLRLRHLLEEERKLRETLETLPVMAWAMEPNGTNQFVNQSCIQYTGLTQAETAGDRWKSIVHPEDRDYYFRRWHSCVASGQAFEEVVRFRRADGEYRWFLSRAVPLRDKRRRILKWCGVSTDIEDRKRAEQLQADLAHTNRVSMLGELAASISHELKQPITATMTNARTSLRWLKREHPDLDEVRLAAERIEKDSARATEIIDRLRALYKKAPPNRELVDVNEIMVEMAGLLRGEANRFAVSIRTDLASDLPKITADRVQLQQILMNLMLNGIEAMNETGGVLTISSRPQNEHVVISVTDTGVGLPLEKADKIFDAFFTTKPQGSGMGLAISRSIVESHNGRLWATPNEGRGASFHFSLPTASPLAENVSH